MKKCILLLFLVSASVMGAIEWERVPPRPLQSDQEVRERQIAIRRRREACLRHLLRLIAYNPSIFAAKL